NRRGGRARPIGSRTATCSRRSGGSSPADRVEDERRAFVQEIVYVLHSKAFHHGARPLVVWFRECDNLVGVEIAERELEPGAADLGRVAACDEVIRNRPADLESGRAA